MARALFVLYILLLAATALAEERIGIYSGTFNPPHYGHTELVAKFRDKLNLDRVYVIPNVVSEHKSDVTPYADRLAMTRLAFAPIKAAVVSDFELEDAFRKNDMTGVLLAIRSRHPEAMLYQIMGSDSFARYVAVKNKPNIANLFLAVRLREDERPTAEQLAQNRATLYEIGLYNQVSSTEIRTALAARRQPEHLAPNVFSYIQSHRLFRSN